MIRRLFNWALTVRQIDGSSPQNKLETRGIRVAMAEESIAYFGPRVMRHRTETGEERFAIHEVYFGKDGQVITHTEDALSDRASSIDQLRDVLQRLLEQEGAEMTTGDLNY